MQEEQEAKQVEILAAGLELENEKTLSGEQRPRLLLQRAEFSGILPPPELLNQYDQICPGLADRIMKIAEGAAAHCHSMDKATLEANIGFHKNQFMEARIGQFCALLIGITAILSGAYVSINGAQIAGGVIGGAGVIGLVSVFIYGRKYKADVEEEKVEEDNE